MTKILASLSAFLHVLLSLLCAAIAAQASAAMGFMDPSDTQAALSFRIFTYALAFRVAYALATRPK